MFNMLPDPNDPEYKRYLREQQQGRPLGGPLGQNAAGQAAIATPEPRTAMPQQAPPGMQVRQPAPQAAVPPPTFGPGGMSGGAPIPQSPMLNTGAPAGGAGFQRANPYAMSRASEAAQMGAGAKPAAAGAAAGGGGGLGGAAIPISVVMDYIQRQQQGNDMRQQAMDNLAMRRAQGGSMRGAQAYAARTNRDASNVQGGDWMKYLMPFMGGRGLG